MNHSDLTKNHPIENWVYANATARTAATGFEDRDVGKLAYQTEDQTYWRLVDLTPTWVGFGATGPAGADGSPGADGADGADGSGVPVGGITDQVLAKASDADGDTEWVTPSGGPGGSLWTQVINEDGSSLANWNVGAGTWATDGTQIAQTNTAVADHTISYVDKIVSQITAFEADLYIASGSSQLFQVYFYDGSLPSGTFAVTFRLSASGGGMRITLDRQEVAIDATSPDNVFSFDTYHNIKFFATAKNVTVWIDDVMVISAGDVSNVSFGQFFAMVSNGSSIQVKNIKLWRMILPWE